MVTVWDQLGGFPAGLCEAYSCICGHLLLLDELVGQLGLADP